MPDTVVVINADATSRAALQRLLNGSSGRKVVSCATIEESVQATLGWVPDVVVTDLVLADTRGLETFQKLRDWYKGPVIVVTSWTVKQDLEAIAADPDARIIDEQGQQTNLIGLIQQAVVELLMAEKTPADDVTKKDVQKTSADAAWKIRVTSELGEIKVDIAAIKRVMLGVAEFGQEPRPGCIARCDEFAKRLVAVEEKLGCDDKRGVLKSLGHRPMPREYIAWAVAIATGVAAAIQQLTGLHVDPPYTPPTVIQKPAYPSESQYDRTRRTLEDAPHELPAARFGT